MKHDFVFDPLTLSLLKAADEIKLFVRKRGFRFFISCASNTILCFSRWIFALKNQS